MGGMAGGSLARGGGVPGAGREAWVSADAGGLQDGGGPQRALCGGGGFVCRRPVVETVLAGDAIAIVVVAQPAEATHHSPQPVPLLQLVSLALEQAQALAGPLEAHLVVLAGDAQMMQIDAFVVVGVDNALIVVGVEVGAGAQGGSEVEDVVVDGAVEVAQGGDEGGFGVLDSAGASVIDGRRHVESSRMLTGELAGGIMTRRAQRVLDGRSQARPTRRFDVSTSPAVAPAELVRPRRDRGRQTGDVLPRVAKTNLALSAPSWTVAPQPPHRRPNPPLRHSPSSLEPLTRHHGRPMIGAPPHDFTAAVAIHYSGHTRNLKL
jgi:hypothetical protein